MRLLAVISSNLLLVDCYVIYLLLLVCVYVCCFCFLFNAAIEIFRWVKLITIRRIARSQKSANEVIRNADPLGLPEIQYVNLASGKQKRYVGNYYITVMRFFTNPIYSYSRVNALTRNPWPMTNLIHRPILQQIRYAAYSLRRQTTCWMVIVFCICAYI